MPSDVTPFSASPELLHAVGQIIAQHVASGDVGQLLAGMDVDLLQQLEAHVRGCDGPMVAWLERMGLPELREEDTFWAGMVLPQILKELERRAEETPFI